MPRRASLKLVATVVLALGGCDCAEDGADRQGPPSITPADVFPATAGNRWRYVSTPDDASRNVGITALENDAAVVFGTSHTQAERFVASTQELAIVSPEGLVLVPLLRAPLTAGSRWEYSLTDKDVAVPCEGQVQEAGVPYDMDGVAILDCVSSTRICRYPAGSPFPRPTTHEVAETWCRGVGRVRETHRFDPAPPFEQMPEERTERLTGFVVAGTTRPPRSAFDCASFILLPSDLRAACGPELQQIEPFGGGMLDGACLYRYGRGDGRLAVTAKAGALPALGDQEETLLELEEGGVTVRIAQRGEVCTEEQARRLTPLLASLLPSR